MPILDQPQQNTYKNAIKRCENLLADLLDSVINSNEPAFADQSNLTAALALNEALETAVEKAKGI